MLDGDPPNYKALSKYHSSSQIPRSAGTKNVPFAPPQFTPKEMLDLGVFGGWYFKGIPPSIPVTGLRKLKSTQLALTLI